VPDTVMVAAEDSYAARPNSVARIRRLLADPARQPDRPASFNRGIGFWG